MYDNLYRKEPLWEIYSLFFPLQWQGTYCCFKLFSWLKTCDRMYRGWLRQDRPCYDINTRPSFSNFRPSFWFFLKPSKARPSISKARLSVSKAQPRVLKQMLGRVIWSSYTLGIFDTGPQKAAFIHLIKALDS